MRESSRINSKSLKGAILAALGATALGLAGMGVALATPVTTWTYNSSSSFNTADTVFGPGHGCNTNSANELAWGEGANGTTCGGSDKYSSLVLDPTGANGNTVDTFIGSGTPTSGFISDPGIVLTHNNHPISLDSRLLQSATLDTFITLTAPPGAPTIPQLNFGILFDETPNVSGQCPVAPTNPANPCPDIFVISHDSLNQEFSYLGDTYFMSLFPTDQNGRLSILPNAACAAAGAADGCFGFVTQENADTPLNFGLSISTTPFVVSVPEPGELGIMGLGLLGLAGLLFMRRRNTSMDSVD